MLKIFDVKFAGKLSDHKP